MRDQIYRKALRALMDLITPTGFDYAPNIIQRLVPCSLSTVSLWNRTGNAMRNIAKHDFLYTRQTFVKQSYLAKRP